MYLSIYDANHVTVFVRMAQILTICLLTSLFLRKATETEILGLTYCLRFGSGF